MRKLILFGAVALVAAAAMAVVAQTTPKPQPAPEKSPERRLEVRVTPEMLRHSRIYDVLYFVDFLYGIGALLLVLGAGWSARWRDAARRALKGKLDLPNGLPPAPIDELALELLGLGGEAARQPSLFAARARQLAEIAETVRHLRARYGRVPLYHVIELEPWSRIPERRWALVQVACDP
jgi:hypothetical protein